MPSNTNIIVFTDLDGSFLDHHSYDFSAAIPALNRLKTLNTQVIATTSKTLAELSALNLPFDTAPQIAENGMVIFDGQKTQTINKTYDEITSFIQNLSPDIRNHINGFYDMSINTVISHTSLTPQNAALAKERLGSEPFLWTGSDHAMDTLTSEAQAQGFTITQGGRFYHIMGEKGGKANAVRTILKDKEEAISIALGDGPNDAEMLGVVDYGIQIPNSSGHDFCIDNPKGEIIKATAQGPEGWNAAINDLLDRLHF